MLYKNGYSSKSYIEYCEEKKKSMTNINMESWFEFLIHNNNRSLLGVYILET
jgi:hypothetical protein